MSSQIGLISFLVASVVAVAQTPTAPTALRPSNEVLELSAKPIVASEPGPQSRIPGVYSPWAGLIEITIRNVSKRVIRLEEIAPAAEFQAEVLDSVGQPVARTEAGKRAANPSRQVLGAISVSLVQMAPLQETTLRMDISRLFEVSPGQAYRVTIRRSRGFPKADEDAKPLRDVELSCSFDVPDYGILR